MKSTERKLRAIMFSDVKSFSAMMAEDEERTMRLIKEHREIVRAALPEYGGEEHGTAGDSFFVLFSSAVQAVKCAVEIQEAFHARNAELPAAERVWIRIGIHVGDIIVDGSDGHVYGDGVNIAARTEPKADPGDICVTHDVYYQVKGKLDLSYEDIGRKEMKNIADAPKLYKIHIGDDDPEPPTRPIGGPELDEMTGKTAKTRRPGLSLALVAFFVLAIGGAALAAFLLSRPEPTPEPIPWPSHPRVAVLPFASSPDREVDKRLWPLVDRMIVNRLSQADLEQNLLERVDPLAVERQMKRREMDGAPSPEEALELARALEAQAYLAGTVSREGGQVRVNATLSLVASGSSKKISGTGPDVRRALPGLVDQLARQLPKVKTTKKREEPPPLVSKAWFDILKDPWSEPSYNRMKEVAQGCSDADLEGFAALTAHLQSKDLECQDVSERLSARYPLTMGPLAPAVCAYKRLDFKGAVALARKAFESLALRPWASTFIRKTLGQIEDADKEIAFNEQRARLYPEDAEQWSFLATQLWGAGQETEAKSLLLVAESLLDESVPEGVAFGVGLNGVRLSLKSEDVPALHRWLDRIREHRPERDLDAMFKAFYEASALELKGRFADSWRVLEKARTRLAANHGEPYATLANMLFYSYLHFDEIELAEKLLDEYRAFFSDKSKPDYWVAELWKLALETSSSGNSTEAIAAKAVSLADSFASTIPAEHSSRKFRDGNLCLFYVHARFDDLSVSLSRKADPSNTMIAGCRFRDGERLLKEGRFADARATFAHARTDMLYRPDLYLEFYLQALYGEAQAALKSGAKDDAKQLFEQIVEQFSDADRDLEQVSAARNAAIH